MKCDNRDCGSNVVGWCQIEAEGYERPSFCSPPSTGSAFPPVLDACCGPRGFWFNPKDERAIFIDRRCEVHVFNHPSGNRTDRIEPDQIADFTDLPFPADTFALVVFDPPHIVQEIPNGEITKRYGVLNGEWKEMLRKGFLECFRVLKPNGTLIFKWSECRIPIREILKLTEEKPLFGHVTSRNLMSHWVCFMKQDPPIVGEESAQK